MIRGVPRLRVTPFANSLHGARAQPRILRFERRNPLTQHITARFTESEIVDATVVLRERIAALEAENARLRARTV
jgi:hypothetical protein